MKTITLYPSLENVMDDFNQYVDSFFNDFRGSHAAPASRLFGRNAGLPAVDLRDTENAYVMDVELPGYEEKTIQVHVDGVRLTIESGQQEKASNKDEGRYLIKERTIRSFSRVFQLPENADPAAITASFKNGVLSLEIKKCAEAQKRLIQINS
ncbi:MAG: Hsp20/alpha crystallin family protein [Treponema sp.]|jgi:HSP20 family protein|nr:Hsp20/alpha crystallin family protein [Treponema sp.]